MKRRVLLTAIGTTALITLISACSGPYSISADVSSFGSWPADRKAGSFAFERMPSQQQDGARQAELEAQAQAALEKAGFKLASDAKSADVLVSLGVRVSPQDRSPWDDPLWWRWHGNYGHWRYGTRGNAMLWTEKRYDREAAILLRDRASSEPLYEARASNDGMTMGNKELVGALFEAALSEFPKIQPEPHRVVVQVAR
ncbi:DUF4136 domain-containing protein [Paucibacter sp. APW11]|uniref:DUF4136 domain-containing protein n=1 Tax=Roseateles aquae TaxID=3077235 RepID=A0ABU3PFA2_9BURK|nr:DUF4136 domain-containing protein [Paucibacter sp. APW11]MDT9000601.1 DUF4136 domain-containing protein [Paucibacter sp. APW11]